MTASPYDGLYWDTHLPLGLYKSLQTQMDRSRKDPNTPNSKNPSFDRQWLSIPRSAKSYSIKHSIYTFEDSADFFTSNGIRTILSNKNQTPDYGKELDYTQSGYAAQVAKGLDPSIFNWFPVAYNTSAFPLNVGIQAAVDKTVKMIQGSSAKVFLAGHGKGAVVTSKLYEEFRSGRLANRRADLLGVFNFGSPMREAGHTIPGGIDPGGHGIALESERLTDTEDLVWEFASPSDPVTAVGDDLFGEVATLYYTKFDTLVSSPATLHEQMMEIINSSLYGELPVLLPFRLAVTSGQGFQLNKLLNVLIREFFSDGGSHDRYQTFYPIAGNNMNAIEVAIAGVQEITLANPPASIGSSATEVLTINYRQPVSISEISFEILKKSCYTQLWYLDRANNWRQMLNENSAPIELRVGHSESAAWYKYSAHTYPIVAKAIQFRISRVSDPLIGDTTYSVGIKNTLVRRNVYNRSSGLQGMEDENDALGNIVSKVIKDWDADKAIDDNASTFWRSFPQPDPDAVVSFYLDTRDAAGNAQLIDKVYLDPVHSGQSLNLYYSNDETVTSRKLNPASLTPIAEYQIGSTTASTGNGSTATITLDTSPNITVGDEITVSGMSPTAYNGNHTVSNVSYSSPYTISFSSTATGSQTAAGVVTTKGQKNFDWVAGKGLKDTVPTDTDISIYRCPFGIGPLVSQDCWIGIQWTPSFNAYSEKSMIIPISTKSVSKVGNVATLELSAAPNVTVGQTITVMGMKPEGYNGTYTVSAVSNTVPYSVSFTTTTTGAQTESGSVITGNFSPGTKNIATTAASGNGSTATITLASSPNVVVGDLITVSGVTPAGYNGTYAVTATSGNNVSYSCAATGSQTVAGTVSTGIKIKIVGINSPSLSNIYSVFDNTTKELIYSKSRDQSSCTFDTNSKILRIPAVNASANCLSSDSITIYYGTNGPAPTQLDLFEALPENTVGSQCWPRIFYDSSNAEITLEVLQPSGGTPLIHSAPLATLFEAGTPINIVVGWKYLEGATPTVYISAQTSRQIPVASLEISSIDFPSQISLDGKVGFKQWRGTFGAHIVKLESYSAGAEAFLANPPVYCNPDPVLVSPGTSTTPSSSLDNAVMAVDWTTQQFAAGGSHSSSYSDKEWTPIWVNYFAERGFLHLPETTSMKYLKLEFSQLTPEPYPVYDEGIKVMYQVYPVTITLVSQQAKGLLGVVNNVFGGIGSVNWLNPSTVYQATNSIFGRTVQPVQTTLQIGAGYTTDALPNTTQTAITESTRTEANSPWVYRRTPVNPFMLVKNYFSNLFGQPQDQGIKSWVPAEAQKSIEDQTASSRPTNASKALTALQGQDWYVFPGQTLRMPANVIDGLTRSQVVTRRDRSKANRTRFTTTAVHQYETKTVTLDANIAYFAGIREVQPYVVSYLNYEDPPEFRFDNYDMMTGWSPVNIEKVGTSSITAKANPYSVRNSRFNASINYWTGDGWEWDNSEGHTLAENWQPGTPLVYGSAHTVANGTNLSLVSEPINVESNAAIKFNAWAVYRDITYTSNAKIWVDAIGLDANNNVIASSINLGNYMEIKSGTNPDSLPGFYRFSDDQPCSSVPQIGVKAIPLYGSVDLATVSSSIRKIQLRLNVNSAVTSGDVWFDDVDMMPSSGIIGSVSKTIKTNSKFSKVKCKFHGSPPRRSDPMWAYLDSNSNDPRRTILAHYVSTVPDTILKGKWLDSISTDWKTAGPWSDSDTPWGSPYAVVSVSYSEAIYDKKRVIHFFRQGSTLESETGQAGIVVRQELNYVSGGLFRICATFFKERNTNNSMEIRLTRVSGIESGPGGPQQYPNGVIHREILTNVPTGYWHTHQGSWIEIPEGQDQVYKVELVLSGSDEDDLYLNDLWTEVSQVRYHVQLGGNNNHDVTALAYQDNCIVGCTEPVNEMAIEVEIHGSNSFITEVQDTVAIDEYTTRMASMSIDDEPTHLTVLEYTFTNEDIGKYVRVSGAGADNAPLKTTITGVSEGKAVLAVPCQTTVSNVMAVFGTDNAVALRNATGFAYSSVFTPLYLQ